MLLDRRYKNPQSKAARQLLDFVAEGNTLSKAVKASPFTYSTVKRWLTFGSGEEPPEEFFTSQKISRGYLESCREFYKGYQAACEERDEKRVQQALEIINKAATEGLAGSEISEETIPERSEIITKTLADGSEVVIRKITPAYTRHHKKVVKARPDWRAAQVLIEKLAPDQYGVRSNVVLKQDLSLKAGEAEEIVTEATDEEMAAIDSGDTTILGKVLSRVRAHKELV